MAEETDVGVGAYGLFLKQGDTFSYKIVITYNLAFL